MQPLVTDKPEISPPLPEVEALMSRIDILNRSRVKAHEAAQELQTSFDTIKKALEDPSVLSPEAIDELRYEAATMHVQLEQILRHLTLQRMGGNDTG